MDPFPSLGGRHSQRARHPTSPQTSLSRRPRQRRRDLTASRHRGHGRHLPHGTSSQGTDPRGDRGLQSPLTGWPNVQVLGPQSPGALPAERLSPEQALALRERLKGLYALLKDHPALMDRRMQVGSHKPQLPPSPGHSQQKRSHRRHLYSREVCPSRTEWRLLHVSRDINNTQVQIFQPHDHSTGHQWFYTTTCLHDQEGDGDGEGYRSHCTTKSSFVMALVRKAHEERFDWNWIRVNTSCSCYIFPA
ncbi:uncharacterized protein LOC143297618 [Babylonia areolata]|uniref:uncharacterized protein LOC143297618 n=1 Tax=Babylonia areolata TaxID=304850 RepID=UPI003FD3842D